jgi:hypothetical protein
MQDWQKQRFVVLSELITDIGVLLSDFNYWANNADKLAEWCENNNCRQEGMLVIFPDKQTLSLFCLRWS